VIERWFLASTLPDKTILQHKRKADFVGFLRDSEGAYGILLWRYYPVLTFLKRLKNG
jgi:hypothetical protein